MTGRFRIPFTVNGRISLSSSRRAKPLSIEKGNNDTFDDLFDFLLFERLCNRRIVLHTGIQLMLDRENAMIRFVSRIQLSPSLSLSFSWREELTGLQIRMKLGQAGCKFVKRCSRQRMECEQVVESGWSLVTRPKGTNEGVPDKVKVEGNGRENTCRLHSAMSGNTNGRIFNFPTLQKVANSFPSLFLSSFPPSFFFFFFLAQIPFFHKRSFARDV